MLAKGVAASYFDRTTNQRFQSVVLDPSKAKGNRNYKEQWRTCGATVYTAKLAARTQVHKMEGKPSPCTASKFYMV
ncbi:hypothetical protein C1H46_019906 [Malus baccata]|uniref:Uncharacterized protein n=1 Tax=Malus baccata TaxID=106549 RepID=A0A540M703_MALBA|nr:hypothetical protein C1H46_019906 [Malus baccata]